jgi:GntR family transcriptional regulator, transcriptional repressor for pyruvate dehydrogenase complex
MLTPIKPKRISDLVFEQLRDLIFKGQIKPGEQLMTERELAENLKVSRPTVREAINRLVTLRLLDHRQGQGTFVVSPSAEKNSLGVPHDQDVSLADLLEVRLGLECNAVMMAARRATEEDIRDMEKNIRDMETDIAAGGLGSDADVRFHMAIAYATKNMVQIHIMRSFYDLLFYGIKSNLQFLYTEPATLEIITRHHNNILKAVCDRDPQLAYNAMREHIMFVLDFVHEKKLS